jgi:hypothetical protein
LSIHANPPPRIGRLNLFGCSAGPTFPCYIDRKPTPTVMLRRSVEGETGRKHSSLGTTFFVRSVPNLPSTGRAPSADPSSILAFARPKVLRVHGYVSRGRHNRIGSALNHRTMEQMQYLLPSAVFLLMVSVGMSLKPAELVAHWRRLAWSTWLSLVISRPSSFLQLLPF